MALLATCSTKEKQKNTLKTNYSIEHLRIGMSMDLVKLLYQNEHQLSTASTYDYGLGGGGDGILISRMAKICCSFIPNTTPIHLEVFL